MPATRAETVLSQIRVPHDALILVGDGQKALFLRNEGSPLKVRLVVERVLEQDNPATREQGTDRPGRTNSRMTTRRAAMEETDWHELGEERFAGRLAAMLYHLAHANRFMKLIIIAPPKVIGRLRPALHPEVLARVAAEIPKELAGHSPLAIQRLLQ